MIRGLLVGIAYIINIVFWSSPILVLAIFKLIPLKFVVAVTDRIIAFCANSWVATNTLIEKHLHPTKVNVNGTSELSPEQWYLLVCNHRSAVDILLLQQILHGNIPLLRFFLKQQLIWVPFLGVAWWALDFPFMRRYSSAFLAKHPHLRGKDLEATQRACEKFKDKPVTVVNFVEGTRLTDEKHRQQASPFRHLLKPRAGGIAFTLSAMQNKITQLINVTIHYRHPAPSLWQYFCGKLDEVTIKISMEPLTTLQNRDYFNSDDDKQAIQQWLNQLWQENDNWLALQEQQNTR